MLPLVKKLIPRTPAHHQPVQDRVPPAAAAPSQSGSGPGWGSSRLRRVGLGYVHEKWQILECNEWMYSPSLVRWGEVGFGSQTAADVHPARHAPRARAIGDPRAKPRLVARARGCARAPRAPRPPRCRGERAQCGLRPAACTPCATTRGAERARPAAFCLCVPLSPAVPRALAYGVRGPHPAGCT